MLLTFLPGELPLALVSAVVYIYVCVCVCVCINGEPYTHAVLVLEAADRTGFLLLVDAPSEHDDNYHMYEIYVLVYKSLRGLFGSTALLSSLFLDPSA